MARTYRPSHIGGYSRGRVKSQAALRNGLPRQPGIGIRFGGAGAVAGAELASDPGEQ
jgi:hypothetical protein